MEDIVLLAYNEKIQNLKLEKEKLEHTYLSKPLQEMDELTKELQEVISKYGTFSIQAQEFYRKSLGPMREIQQRIKAQDKPGAVGKAMERLAEIETALQSLETEKSIRIHLMEKKFSLSA